ncbi:hypothetical protein PspLS_08275 [Pyricularia sp. CBS 133598]|nr:hypothetical protein PspLS_08275 [Pyricularia sp. CBS 133598]
MASTWKPKDDTDIKYQWLKFNLFTTWLPSTNQIIFFVFDPVPDVKNKIRDRLKKAILDCHQQRDHFWVYSQILHDVISLHHDAIWAIRDYIRSTETAKPTPETTFKTTEETAPNFRHLHDVARHSIHICETLELACINMHELLGFFTSSSLSQRSHFTLKIDKQIAATAASKEASRNRLLFQRNSLRSYRLRAQVNKERLENEIGLTFNNIAQQNALLAVEIGRATRTDGLAVKTIAFVTFAFLPATLICAIFSMPFFELESGTGKLLVSDKF